MITGFYAGLSGLLMLWLAWKVVQVRQRSNIGIGDGGNPDLQRAIRVHANFIEYVPLALIMLLILEVTGTPPGFVHIFGFTLFMSRVLHAHGLSGNSGYSKSRFYGTLGTWLTVAGMAGLLVFSGLMSTVN